LEPAWKEDKMPKLKSMKVQALRAAFPLTIPIMAGFLFLGTTYGIYMRLSGFSFWYPALISLLVFGGSLQFVLVPLLLAPFAPLETLVLALFLQARHLFYGISMLDQYHNLGWKRFYLIFALCDETFSVAYSARIPQGVDAGWFYFFISLLNHLYWFLGSLVGGLAGSLVQFETRGLDFVLTALFLVIFLDQWSSKGQHLPALTGILVSITGLLILGPDSFLLPVMAAILILLSMGRTFVEKEARQP
jgi:4-azaleucine resistance transporter AzlC